MLSVLLRADKHVECVLEGAAEDQPDRVLVVQGGAGVAVWLSQKVQA